MEEKIYDMLVVGGGPAGYTAALYGARAGLSVRVIETLSPGGQMATTEQIDNYPGFEDGIDGQQLAERMQRGAERFGAESVFGQALSADLSQSPKRIETESGTFLGHTVVLAMGAAPRELGLADERALRGKGVAYCATCDGMFYRGKTVAVVGGGNSAAADALFLSKLCKKVYLVHRRDELRASRRERALLEESGVEFLLSRRPVAILHEKRVTGLRLEDVKTGEVSDLAVDGVFVAIGRVPSTELVRGQVELDEAGYVLADESTRTNLPGVYAAGDLRQKPLRQIVTAAADGATAAHFAEEYVYRL